jgi:hypothetical protein
MFMLVFYSENEEENKLTRLCEVSQPSFLTDLIEFLSGN